MLYCSPTKAGSSLESGVQGIARLRQFRSQRVNSASLLLIDSLLSRLFVPPAQCLKSCLDRRSPDPAARIMRLREHFKLARAHRRNKTIDKTIDKTLSQVLAKPKPPSRRVARLVKRKRTRFSSLFLSCEDYWDPSWHEIGLGPDRTGGLGPASGRDTTQPLRHTTSSM